MLQSIPVEGPEPMRRVLRNYLISFVIIGLFFLVVHLINRYVESRYPEAVKPPSVNQGALLLTGKSAECERKRAALNSDPATSIARVLGAHP